MNNTIVGLVLILMGSLVIIYRIRIAQAAVDFQNKTFGFHFGETDVRANSYVGILVGVVTIILGLLTISSIIDPK